MGVLSASFTILALVLKPIINTGSYFAGRGIRFWWGRKSPAEQRILINNVFVNIDKFASGFVVTGLAIWWWYERHTRVCPITGRKQFVFLTEQHVHRLAAVVRNGMLRSCQGRLLPRYDPRTIRVDCIARHVIRSNAGVPELTRTRWNVHVVDNEDVANAIVLPIGDIFVFTGLLKLCENYDQLAIVMAHEIAHTILDHQAEDLSNDHLEDVIIAFPLTLLCTVMPSPVAAAVFRGLFRRCVDIFVSKPYSRRMEREADRVGLFLAANACADPGQAVAFWSRVAEGRRGVGERAAQAAADFLSTHPSDKERIELLRRTMPMARATWERRGCGDGSRGEPYLETAVSKYLIHSQSGRETRDGTGRDLE